MSIKKTPSLNDQAIKVKEGQCSTPKRRRLTKCFPFMEIATEPGKSLKEIDSKKFKDEIKRWAKAVVEYARQVSEKFGSSGRSGSRIVSSRESEEESN